MFTSLEHDATQLFRVSHFVLRFLYHTAASAWLVLYHKIVNMFSGYCSLFLLD